MDSEFETEIETYFGECSPALTNFLMTLKRQTTLPFDKVKFYYLPSTYRDRFPFRVLFFAGEENITGPTEQSTLLKIQIEIMGRFPSVFQHGSAFFDADTAEMPIGTEIGIDQAVFDVMCKNLSQLAKTLHISSPTLVAEMHDSDLEVPLNA